MAGLDAKVPKVEFNCFFMWIRDVKSGADVCCWLPGLTGNYGPRLSSVHIVEGTIGF